VSESAPGSEYTPPPRAPRTGWRRLFPGRTLH
jgi:hypothetical protein